MNTDESQAVQVPLIEQLRSVPKDAREILDLGDFPVGDWRRGSRNIPYGRLCHEAADALESRATAPTITPEDLKPIREALNRILNRAMVHDQEL